MTKWQLMNMLTLPLSSASVVIDSQGNSHIGIVRSIEREDGSGKCFNVKMFTTVGGHKHINIFVRTID